MITTREKALNNRPQRTKKLRFDVATLFGPLWSGVMSTNMNKYATIIILFILSGKSFACAIPAQGTYWTHKELIDKTDTILLVTPVSDDHNYRFKVLETIKGENSANLQWHRFRPKDLHRSEDFEGHNRKEFWPEGDETIIRATYYPGQCTLQFTFVAGENYLIFKESSGHVHSAEIIKSSKDKWYQYVRARVTNNRVRTGLYPALPTPPHRAVPQWAVHHP